MKIRKEGMKRTKCNYSRVEPLDPWLGIIELDDVD